MPRTFCPELDEEGALQDAPDAGLEIQASQPT
jgi:hypothetical protein